MHPKQKARLAEVRRKRERQELYEEEKATRRLRSRRIKAALFAALIIGVSLAMGFAV